MFTYIFHILEFPWISWNFFISRKLPGNDKDSRNSGNFLQSGNTATARWLITGCCLRALSTEWRAECSGHGGNPSRRPWDESISNNNQTLPKEPWMGYVWFEIRPVSTTRVSVYPPSKSFYTYDELDDWVHGNMKNLCVCVCVCVCVLCLYSVHVYSVCVIDFYVSDWMDGVVQCFLHMTQFTMSA